MSRYFLLTDAGDGTALNGFLILGLEAAALPPGEAAYPFVLAHAGLGQVEIAECKVCCDGTATTFLGVYAPDEARKNTF